MSTSCALLKLAFVQARTPTPPRQQSIPMAVAQVRQDAELADGEVAAAWAGQLAAALEMNQDLEDSIVSLRQQNANLRRCDGQQSRCLQSMSRSPAENA